MKNVCMFYVKGIGCSRQFKIKSKLHVTVLIIQVKNKFVNGFITDLYTLYKKYFVFYKVYTIKICAFLN